MGFDGKVAAFNDDWWALLVTCLELKLGYIPPSNDIESEIEKCSEPLKGDLKFIYRSCIAKLPIDANSVATLGGNFKNMIEDMKNAVEDIYQSFFN